MALEVDFTHLENDEPVKFATLRWNGSAMTITPPKHPRIAEILRESIFLPKGGGRLYAEEDPEKFMHHLCDQYHGFAFSASEARLV